MAEIDNSMLELFTFEMSRLLEQLEQNIIEGESGYTMDKINEIFRIMHTIKGSAAMMMFNNVSAAAHVIEDLFFYLREENPTNLDCSTITDHVLESMDFIKEEINKIEAGLPSDGNPTEVSAKIKDYLVQIKLENGSPAQKTDSAKNKSNLTASSIDASGRTDEFGRINGMSGMDSTGTSYFAKIIFDEGCEMENVRSFTLINNMKDYCKNIASFPADIIDEASIEMIKAFGISLSFDSDLSYDEVLEHLKSTVYLRDVCLEKRSVVLELPYDGVFRYDAIVRFEEETEMENVRSFTIINGLKDIMYGYKTEPGDLMVEANAFAIKKDALHLSFTTDKPYHEIEPHFAEAIFVKHYILFQSENEKYNEAAIDAVSAPSVSTAEIVSAADTASKTDEDVKTAKKAAVVQSVINVSVSKLDQLVKLMGELVISEAMVTQNPELDGLELENFHKEARQMRKFIDEIQETVMSMRMVPLSTTFFKMHRIVRDMCKQLGKDIVLDVIGEETEVDKNIIEHISDPLMHIIRNSADHGIELPNARRAAGKPEKGTIRLEAKNSGSDVLIMITDDGAGLNKAKIMDKAKQNGLLTRPENEYTDKEIFQFIFMPGFSTNEAVTSFSGRGVGMDVVCKNLEHARGTVLIDSVSGEGSTFTLKIPISMTIIKGMLFTMGGQKYTIQINSISESFKPKKEDIFIEAGGNEMITVREQVYNIVRLNQFFGVTNALTDLEDGIMMVVEDGDARLCLFVDDLVGEQQIVVKSMPKYLNKIQGLSGCTLLGNGDISLIIDPAGLFSK